MDNVREVGKKALFLSRCFVINLELSSDLVEQNGNSLNYSLWLFEKTERSFMDYSAFVSYLGPRAEAFILLNVRT